VVAVPLPANETAQSVWSNPAYKAYLANSTLFTNWISAPGETTAASTGTGTGTGTGIISSLQQANVSYKIYAVTANQSSASTSTFFLNQYPGLSTTGISPLNIVAPATAVLREARNNLIPSVSFVNSSDLTVYRLLTFLLPSQPFTNKGTFLMVFYPQTPTTTPVLLPNFIYGYGVTPSIDRVPHTQSDVTSAISATFLKSKA
jgi:hypothetical protein